jgi:hypothetical protein
MSQTRDSSRAEYLCDTAVLPESTDLPPLVRRRAPDVAARRHSAKRPARASVRADRVSSADDGAVVVGCSLDASRMAGRGHAVIGELR